MPDESGSNDLYLTDLSPTDKPWDVHRAIAGTIESLYELAPTYEGAQLDYKRYAERIHQCAQLLNFVFQPQENGEYRLKLHDAHFCRVRHCPICQWRRSLMWRAKFFTALPMVTEAYPTARWVFLTLTVKNCPLNKLRDTLGQMNRAWKRLTERKAFPGLGWVKSVEVTRAPDNSAHPHFHCLVLVPASYFSGRSYLKHEEWTKLWQQCLRVDYTPIVHIRTIKARAGGKVESSEKVSESSIQAALLETLKYSVKPADLAGLSNPVHREANAAWLAELTEQLYKTRAISVGGILKKFVSDEEPEDLVHAEGEEVTLTEKDLEVWFGWREMIQRYLKVEANGE